MKIHVNYSDTHKKIQYTVYTFELSEEIMRKHKCRWSRRYSNVFETEQEYGSPVILMRNVSYFIFRDTYNEPIVLTPHVIHLTFGQRFNQSIILSYRIQCLTLGYFFKLPIVLTPNIRRLNLGGHFNQMIVLTKRITHLTLGQKFNQPIILTKHITHLTLGQYCHPIVFTHHVVRLQIENHNYYVMDNLPNEIKDIMLSKFFRAPLKNIPNSVKISKIYLFTFYGNQILQTNTQTR